MSASDGKPARASAVRLPILMYHHVGPLRAGTNANLTITPGIFQRQMRRLSRAGYSTIDSTDWLAYLGGTRPLPRKPVMLTFDDGYSDLIEFALPVLRSLGLKATVYIVTGHIGGENLWDQQQGYGPHALMNAAQICQWRDAGLEVGSHSRTHPELPAISARQRQAEIEGSSRDLRQILGEPPVSFAYPYGKWDEEVAAQVGRHYRLGVTTDEGMNDAVTPPLQLRRTMVQPCDTLLEFASRVRWGSSPLEQFRRRVWRGKERIRRVWQ